LERRLLHEMAMSPETDLSDPHWEGSSLRVPQNSARAAIRLQEFFSRLVSPPLLCGQRSARIGDYLGNLIWDAGFVVDVNVDFADWEENALPYVRRTEGSPGRVRLDALVSQTWDALCTTSLDKTALRMGKGQHGTIPTRSLQPTEKNAQGACRLRISAAEVRFLLLLCLAAFMVMSDNPHTASIHILRLQFASQHIQPVLVNEDGEDGVCIRGRGGVSRSGSNAGCTNL
jgi:hypothetical protein